MSKILFITDSWSSGSTVFSETTGPGSAAANLLDIDPAVIWSTPISGDGDFTLTGPLGAVDSFVLTYGVSTNVDTWRIIAAATQPEITSNPIFDTGSIPLWPHDGLGGLTYVHSVYRHSTPVEIGAVQISVSALTTFTAGNILISQAFEPSHNYSPQNGYGFGVVDDSTVRRLGSGRDAVFREPAHFKGSVSMPWQTLADRAEFLRLARLYGSHHPIFVVYDLDDTVAGHDGMGYVRMQWEDPPVRASRQQANRFTVNLRFVEHGPI